MVLVCGDEAIMMDLVCIRTLMQAAPGHSPFTTENLKSPELCTAGRSTISSHGLKTEISLLSVLCDDCCRCGCENGRKIE